MESIGLNYTKVDNAYVVNGRGSCEDVDIVIPSVHDGLNVVGIDKNAFRDDKTIKSVTFSDGIEFIGWDSFCFSSVQAVKIGKGLKKIDNYAFVDCFELEKIEFGADVESIGNYAFRGCKFSETVVLPNGLKSIGERAFNKCFKLTSIVIPQGITFIGDRAFQEAPGLDRGRMRHMTFYCLCDEAQWHKITTSEDIAGNGIEEGCFYREKKPDDRGNYWHYDVHGRPVEW